MIIKLFFCLPLRRSLFLQTLSNFPLISQFLQTVMLPTAMPPQKISSCTSLPTDLTYLLPADAAKMLKRMPSLGRLKTLDKVEHLAYMLNRHGCTDDQIANVIRVQPSLLLTSVERVLEPKIRVLEDLCSERENVSKIVTRWPTILTYKLERLCYSLKLLKTVIPTEDILIRAIMRNPQILGRVPCKTMESSIAFWQDFGFRGTELTKLVRLNHFVLTRSFLTLDQLDFIHKIGTHKESNMYKYIVKIVATRRIEKLEARIDNLQLCGLSPEEALQVVRAHPSILGISGENVNKKMDFMLNHMELSVDFVTKHPVMFAMSLSLDKVMRPRFLVLQNITAMNGAREVNPTRLCTMLKMTEAKFAAQIIQGHPQSASLRTVYENAIANVL